MPTIPGVEDLPRRGLPHRPVAARAGELRGQARRGDRHRRDRGAGDHRDRQDGGPPDRVPAHAELVRAAAQQPDRRGAPRRASRRRYPEIFALCRDSFGCFIHQADPRKALEVSPEEREAFYEKLYREPGFGIWMGNFRDMLVDPEANATITEFMRRKIRARVQGPEGRGEADPDQPRLRHPPRAARERLLRGLQPAERAARGHPGDADRADHARRHPDEPTSSARST